MVSDACGRRDPWLLIGGLGRFPGHHLYIAWPFYHLVQCSDSELAQSNDVRHHLLCYPVQLRWNHPRRDLGRSILGAVLGMGPEGEWSASYRTVERHHSSRRWGGFICETGLSVMSVFGNIVGSLFWVGVNMARGGL